MTFQEIVNAVVAETGRPDMDSSQGGDGQIQQYVQKATAFLHSMDFFFRDIVPVTVQFDLPAYIQTLQTPIFPRYRSLAYARKNDPTMGQYQQNPSLLPPLFDSNHAVNWKQSMAMFTQIALDKIFDEYGYGTEKLDVMYQAGDTVFFKSSSSFSNILFAYYAFPDINPQTYTSWIARDFPFAIVSVASANIFDATGKDAAARKLDSPDGTIAFWTRNILMSNIEMQGR